MSLEPKLAADLFVADDSTGGQVLARFFDELALLVGLGLIVHRGLPEHAR